MAIMHATLAGPGGAGRTPNRDEIEVKGRELEQKRADGGCRTDSSVTKVASTAVEVELN